MSHLVLPLFALCLQRVQLYFGINRVDCQGLADPFGQEVL